MDTERLRMLAASYRSRADGGMNKLARAYEAEMADYLEEVAAWIEARLHPNSPDPPQSPGSPAPPIKP